LYERDPEAWRAYLAEGNRTQARKRVGADVLFRDEVGRILPVEELGIAFPAGRLLVVDWVAPHGPWDDSLMFVFDGGVLSEEKRAGTRLSDRESAAFRFFHPDEASEALRA
jgi:hypothetical protein